MAKKVSTREFLVARRVGQKEPMAPPDDAFRGKWPQLFDLLTWPVRWNDQLLESQRLSVTMGDGDWIFTLSDNVLKQSLTIRSDTFEEGLDNLECLASSPDAKWVVWRNKKCKLEIEPGKKRKKKLDTPNGSE